jgi:hypothetical protein
MKPSQNTTGLCMCGCGLPAAASAKTDSRRGLIKGQPVRFLPGHHSRRNASPVSPLRYAVTESGCWQWQLRLSRHGYGKLKQNGRVVFAHRALYEQRHGKVPAHLELDHLCRNRACVNPAHLEAVTPTENKRRSRATKLTVADVAAIKASPLGPTELGRIYGVTQSNISHIRRGSSWRDVHAA